MQPSADVAVVGAGIVGLSTARALRDRGLHVTVYERHAPGGGQSAGRTRIFRLNHADARLVALAQRARLIWRRWEDEYGVSLIGRDGVLVAGPTAPARRDGLRQAGEHGAWVDAAEQAACLPLLRPFAGPVLLDAGGGPIRTDEAIRVLAGDLREALRQTEVLAVRPVPGPAVELLTPQGSHGHDAAVLCAGQDTVRLARQFGLDLPIELSLHLRATFRVHGTPPDRMSCLQDSSGEYADTAYGSPYPSRDMFALGLSGGTGELAADDTDLALERFDEIRRRACAYVRAALPGLRPEPIHDVTCWVTRLPWGSDGVAAWTTNAITTIAGNNLFKHAPAVGELLADAVCAGDVPEILRPATELGRSRPASGSSSTAAGRPERRLSA
jgi:glycine/D-amino acid oxidase-like deaminating enzyme